MNTAAVNDQASPGSSGVGNHLKGSIAAGAQQAVPAFANLAASDSLNSGVEAELRVRWRKELEAQTANEGLSELRESADQAKPAEMGDQNHTGSKRTVGPQTQWTSHGATSGGIPLALAKGASSVANVSPSDASNLAPNPVGVQGSRARLADATFSASSPILGSGSRGKRMSAAHEDAPTSSIDRHSQPASSKLGTTSTGDQKQAETTIPINQQGLIEVDFQRSQALVAGHAVAASDVPISGRVTDATQGKTEESGSPTVELSGDKQPSAPRGTGQGSQISSAIPPTATNLESANDNSALRSLANGMEASGRTSKEQFASSQDPTEWSAARQEPIRITAKSSGEKQAGLAAAAGGVNDKSSTGITAHSYSSALPASNDKAEPIAISAQLSSQVMDDLRAQREPGGGSPGTKGTYIAGKSESQGSSALLNQNATGVQTLSQDNVTAPQSAIASRTGTTSSNLDLGTPDSESLSVNSMDVDLSLQGHNAESSPTPNTFTSSAHSSHLIVRPTAALNSERATRFISDSKGSGNRTSGGAESTLEAGNLPIALIVPSSSELNRTSRGQADGAGESPFQAIDEQGSPGVNGSTLAGKSGVTHSGSVHSPGLEVGYQDPALGYVELRAHSVGAGVHASLTVESAESGSVLTGHLASLETWMHDRQTSIESVTVVATGASRGSTVDSGLGGGGQFNGGHAASDHGSSQRQDSTLSGTSAIAGLGEKLGAGSSIVQTSSPYLQGEVRAGFSAVA